VQTDPMPENSTELHICRLCDNIFFSETNDDLCDKSICNKFTSDGRPTEYADRSEVFAETEPDRKPSKSPCAKHETCRQNNFSKWCICDECHKRFDDTVTMNTHINAVHHDRKSWSCSYCTRIFGSVQSLCEHKRMHFINNTFNCGERSKVFCDNNKLQDHVLYVHHEPKQFQCTVCHLGFSSHEQALVHTVHNHGTDAILVEQKKCKPSSTWRNLIRRLWCRLKPYPMTHYSFRRT
jgi:hypothetical protein